MWEESIGHCLLFIQEQLVRKLGWDLGKAFRFLTITKKRYTKEVVFEAIFRLGVLIPEYDRATMHPVFSLRSNPAAAFPPNLPGAAPIPGSPNISPPGTGAAPVVQPGAPNGEGFIKNQFVPNAGAYPPNAYPANAMPTFNPHTPGPNGIHRTPSQPNFYNPAGATGAATYPPPSTPANPMSYNSAPGATSSPSPSPGIPSLPPQRMDSMHSVGSNTSLSSSPLEKLIEGHYRNASEAELEEVAKKLSNSTFTVKRLRVLHDSNISNRFLKAGLHANEQLKPKNHSVFQLLNLAPLHQLLPVLLDLKSTPIQHTILGRFTNNTAALNNERPAQVLLCDVIFEATEKDPQNKEVFRVTNTGYIAPALLVDLEWPKISP